MARLEYEITGTVTGLSSAASTAGGILQNLKAQADSLKLNLFTEQDVTRLGGIGNALQGVTGQIKAYVEAATRGGQAFQDQTAVATLDALSTKLNVLAGNALLFGDSIQSQEAEIKAYQSAINGLFAAGLDPLDAKITSLKSKIDSLTVSIEQQKAAQAGIAPTATTQAFDALSAKLSVLQGNVAIFGSSIANSQAQVRAYQSAIDSLLKSGVDPFDVKIGILKRDMDALTASIVQQKKEAAGDPFARYKSSGGIIERLTVQIRNLREASSKATDEGSIERYNRRLERASAELQRLNQLGLTAEQVARRAGGGYNAFGTELSRVIQDAPFAANNFGAIGNNITRAAETFGSYRQGLIAAAQAQGQVATTGTLLRSGLGGLVTGFTGITLAISLAVSAYTFYQQYQQKAKRDAEEAAKAVEKNKNALDDYVKTLDASGRAQARAATDTSSDAQKLDELYNSLLKNTDARYRNNSALQELQKTWPEEFGNLQKGVGFVDALSAGYLRLRENIRQTGIANAASKLSAEASENFLKNSLALEDATRKEKEAQDALNVALANRTKLEEQNRQKAQGNRFNNNTNVEDQITPYRNRLKDAQNTTEEFRISTFKARQEIDRFNQVVRDANGKIVGNTPGLQQQLEQQISALEQRRRLSKDENDIAKLNADIKAKQAELDALLGRKQENRVQAAAKELSLAQQLSDLQNKVRARVGQSGLEGYALDVQKVKDEYKALNAQLDKFVASVEVQRKGGKISGGSASRLENTASGIRSSLVAGKNKELGDLAVKEAERVSSEITRINNEFGLKSQDSRAREIAGINARYDEELAKITGTGEAIKRQQDNLSAARVAALEATNEKFDMLETGYFKKIAEFEDSAFNQVKGREASKTDRIKQEWDKRIEDAREAYRKIRELRDANFVPFFGVGDGINQIIKNAGTLDVNKSESETVDLGNKGKDSAVAYADGEAIRSGLTSAFNGFFGDLVQGLNGISNVIGNNQAIKSKIQSLHDYDKTLKDSLNFTTDKDKVNNDIRENQKQISVLQLQLVSTFKSTFSTIVASFNQTIQNSVFSVIQKQLQTKLEKGLNDGVKGLGPKLQQVIGGLAIAGGLISGLTPKTSKVGQGLGGALSGAAAGAAVGSIIPGVGTLVGGAVGGLVGLVGGIFGASKAQKELQAQQLAEQKQANDLLRQSIAYTSTVIGRMTTSGVVTGVDVNAFGQLVTTVAGQDLKLILDRNKRTR